MKRLLIILLRLYQLLLSPFLAMNGGRCRFHPNCSAYAIEAVQTHGIRKGAGLSLRRISRCHPWGGGGVDPVPPRNFDRMCQAEPAGNDFENRSVNGLQSVRTGVPRTGSAES